MKYSYSPSAGFQATPTPGHSRVVSLGQAIPTLPPKVTTPAPAAPGYPMPMSPPMSPPATSPTPGSSFYGGYAGGQQPAGPPPGYAPPLPPRRPSEASQKSPTAYTPVDFDSPHPSGLTPELFYGNLIDSSGRPTQIFSRMSDASFFWLDQTCDVPGLRGTGVIEPAKYGWLMGKLGQPPEVCQLTHQWLPSFYTAAGIPCRYVQTPQGQIPVVDRRGWLHLCVFEARATPGEAFDTWTKSLAMLALRDPATGAPFPTPLPRGALPAVAEPSLHAAYLGWQTQAVVAIQKQRTDAMVQNIIGASRPSYNFNPYSVGAGALGGGAGALGANALGGAGAGAGGGGDSGNGGEGGHTSVLETVNNVATLANTVLGAFGVGGGGAAGGNAGGGGAAQLGATALGALGGNAFGNPYAYGTGYGF